jgi:hypothetical protein
MLLFYFPSARNLETRFNTRMTSFLCISFTVVVS